MVSFNGPSSFIHIVLFNQQNTFINAENCTYCCSIHKIIQTRFMFAKNMKLIKKFCERSSKFNLSSSSNNVTQFWSKYKIDTNVKLVQIGHTKSKYKLIETILPSDNHVCLSLLHRTSRYLVRGNFTDGFFSNVLLCFTLLKYFFESDIS